LALDAGALRDHDNGEVLVAAKLAQLVQVHVSLGFVELKQACSDVAQRAQKHLPVQAYGGFLKTYLVELKGAWAGQHHNRWLSRLVHERLSTFAHYGSSPAAMSINFCSHASQVGMKARISFALSQWSTPLKCISLASASPERPQSD
jgi:hypothetical protein